MLHLTKNKLFSTLLFFPLSLSPYQLSHDNYQFATGKFFNVFILLVLIIQLAGLNQYRGPYEQIEEWYAKLLSKASRIMIIVVAVMHGPPLSQPLSYVIFNRPEPQDWVLSGGIA